MSSEYEDAFHALFGEGLDYKSTMDMTDRLFNHPCEKCEQMLGITVVHSPETWAAIMKDRDNV